MKIHPFKNRIMEVDVNPDLLILLEYGHNISNLVCVLFLSNESTFDEFMYFVFDCLCNIEVKLSLLLLN